MSVAICSRSSSSVSFPLERKEVLLGSILMPSPSAAASCGNRAGAEKDDGGGESPPGEVEIWSSIFQAHKLAKQPPNADADEPPYVHPLTRLASGRLMSQKSLEVCTESLGSETGSDDYLDDMDSSSFPIKVQQHEQDVVLDHHDYELDDDERAAGMKKRRKEQDAAAAAAPAVNYHCSISRRSPSRSFPPPLPSISRRDGPCVQMRPHRKDGRLVVEAVAVPSQNYLHAQRRGGRLLLSFINTTTPNRNPSLTPEPPTRAQQLVEEEEPEPEPEQEVVDEEEEEEEEEVEVVDRGTVVEVKVSTQPQQQSGGSAAVKVHRSSIVINKFVSCTSLGSSQGKEEEEEDQNVVEHARTTSPRRSTASTTAAAAAVAASSLGTLPVDDGSQPRSFDNKVFFTSKRRNREELLRDMRRCSQLRKPLFIWEPCCIATSS